MPLDSIPKFLSYLAVILFVAVVGHSLAKDRVNHSKRSRRKNDLLQFLKVWEHDIQSGLNLYFAVANTFDARKRELIRLTSVMRSDYSGSEFSAKIKAITDMNAGAVD